MLCINLFAFKINQFRRGIYITRFFTPFLPNMYIKMLLMAVGIYRYLDLDIIDI